MIFFILAAVAAVAFVAHELVLGSSRKDVGQIDFQVNVNRNGLAHVVL
jgi:hypothetical protein